MIADLPDLIARRAALTPRRGSRSRSGDRAHADLCRARPIAPARAAALLAARGVGEGDRVAILCRNRIEFFELLFGCAKLGAILVPLNWRMPPAELDGLIADAEPALLLPRRREDAAAAPRWPRRRRRSISTAIMRRCSPTRRRPRRGARSGRPTAIWYLLYTSGTTGRPKGVIYTYRMALANYVNIGSAIDLSSADTTADFLPLFHTAGINLHALADADRRRPGASSWTAFDADALVDLLEARRLDTFFAVPTVYQALLDHPRFAAAPLDHVRHWGCGGAPLPDALAERYRDARHPRLQRHGHDRDRADRLPASIPPTPGTGSARSASRSCCAASASSTRDGRDGRRRRGRRPAVRRTRRHARLLAQRGGDPRRLHRRRLAALGRPRPPRRRRLLSRSPGGGRRCSSRAARTSIRPRSRMCLSAHPGGASTPRCSPSPTRNGARSAAPSSSWRRTAAAPDGAELDRLLPRPPRRLQGAEALRVRRRFPAHLGRQDPEASAAAGILKPSAAGPENATLESPPPPVRTRKETGGICLSGQSFTPASMVDAVFTVLAPAGAPASAIFLSLVRTVSLRRQSRLRSRQVPLACRVC